MFSSALGGDGRHNSCWQFFFGRKRGVGIKDDFVHMYKGNLVQGIDAVHRAECVCYLSGGYRQAAEGERPEGPAAAIVRTVGSAAGTVSVCVGYGLQAGPAVGCGGHPCYGALKGRAISQYYAVPHHRDSCDLNVFIGKGWERACELLEGRGVELGREVYKEVEFTMDDVYVECHRYITPLRGNRQLQAFERYLRSLLESGEPSFFEGTTLVCPPLMFSVMLYVEHALGDFLHGKLLLKHVVDWVVLRRQAVDWEAFVAKCKEFRFDRFVALIEALADVVEGKREYEALPDAYKEAFDEMLREQEPQSGQRSWFQRRVSLFFDIIKNGKKFRRYGYTSMPSYLFHSVWTHFFDREVRGI